eukprot:gene3051-biopygen988
MFVLESSEIARFCKDPEADRAAVREGMGNDILLAAGRSWGNLPIWVGRESTEDVHAAGRSCCWTFMLRDVHTAGRSCCRRSPPPTAQRARVPALLRRRCAGVLSRGGARVLPRGGARGLPRGGLVGVAAAGDEVRELLPRGDEHRQLLPRRRRHFIRAKKARPPRIGRRRRRVFASAIRCFCHTQHPYYLAADYNISAAVRAALVGSAPRRVRKCGEPGARKCYGVEPCPYCRA